MAHLSVVQAVEDRLKAGFSECPVFVENAAVDGTPNSGSEWLLLHFPWSRSEWTTADEFTEEGGFEIVLALVAGDGAHKGREWMDQIASLFRGAAFDGVQCYAPNSPVTDDRSEAGAFFRLRMAVPYEFIVTQEA